VTLRLGPKTAPVRSGIASPVLDAVAAAQERGGELAEVIKRLKRQFSADLSGFDKDVLRPALMRRGLLVQGERRMLGLFKVRQDALTPAGEAEQVRVTAAMQRARAIPELLDRRPEEAAALALAAGGAILLMPELRAHYQQLGAVMKPEQGGGFSFGDGSSFDFGSFDSGAFDSFDNAAAAFETSFDADAGGGDSGGDSNSDSGGGGDSGGC
jgi:hypothetical protein